MLVVAYSKFQYESQVTRQEACYPTKLDTLNFRPACLRKIASRKMQLVLSVPSIEIARFIPTSPTKAWEMGITVNHILSLYQVL